MKEIYAYHVVTDRPMYVGQHIFFDETHHNGVYQRVQDKSAMVNDIYSHPEKYNADTLEHHTSVALRETALEEIRLQKFPEYPSRMGCLYVSKTLEEAEKWCKSFIDWGRPTYHIVRLKIVGNCFIGDANNCFSGQLNKEQNLLLAEHYWENRPNVSKDEPIFEMLVDGDIEVVEIVREVNANLPKQIELPIPTHLQNFLIPIGDKNSEYEVTGTIRCTCGSENFEIHESNERVITKLICKACGEEILLFDAGKHGWNGFVCGDDFLNRELPFEKYHCPECSKDSFCISVCISSQGKQDFLDECVSDDDGFTIDDWIDGFEWITVDTTCTNCGKPEEHWLDYETM